MPNRTRSLSRQSTPCKSVALPGSAQDYSRTGVGCGWGGQITIIGTYGTGGTCTASYSGNLPHNRPCDQCAASGIAPLDGIQNAANGRAYAAPGSIVAAYGSGIATTTQGAGFLPLPTELAGVKVFAGPNAEQCQLFYVSPGQVNFLLPNLGVGLNQITIVNASGSQFRGDLFLTHPAPGVFTRDGLRVAADFYPWGVSLYATGIVPEWVADPRDVRIRTGGIEYPASWVGYAPGFAGLVQINVPLPPGVVGSGASLF